MQRSPKDCENTAPDVIQASFDPAPPLVDRFKWKRHASHRQALRRIAIRAAPPENVPLFAKCTNWLFPWSCPSYPGLARGVLAILTTPVTPRAVGLWRQGKNPTPAWVARDVRLHMQDLVDQANTLIQALKDLEDAEARKPKRIDRGFCVTRAARTKPAPGDPI